MTAFPIRDARVADVPALARLWFEGWQDAHAAILPDAWRRARTLDSFAERLRTGIADVRIAMGDDGPLGFTMAKGDELDQLFVARAARGGGCAAALIADATVRMKAAGVRIAWLACAIGNDRAARFYEKQGWRRASAIMREIADAQGVVRTEVWRYEIDLA